MVEVFTSQNVKTQSGFDFRNPIHIMDMEEQVNRAISHNKVSDKDVVSVQYEYADQDKLQAFAIITVRVEK